MNNYSKLYWLTRLDSISTLFTMLLIFSCIFLILYLFIRFIASDITEWSDGAKLKFENSTKFLRRLAYVLIISSSIIITFTPTKNEAIVILAGGKAMDYIQSDTSLSKVPYQTTSIISEYLDKTLKEMKSENKK
jgi:Na+/H+ antiporter NhaC